MMSEKLEYAVPFDFKVGDSLKTQGTEEEDAELFRLMGMESPTHNLGDKVTSEEPTKAKHECPVCGKLFDSEKDYCDHAYQHLKSIQDDSKPGFEDTPDSESTKMKK